MEKIKLEDFLKDPLPGRWIKDKDGFLTKDVIASPSINSGQAGAKQSQDSSPSVQNDSADKKVSADLPGEDSSETGESKADS